MVKLILFGLLCIILPVQTKYEMQVIEEGDPLHFVCDNPSARWRLHGVNVAYCKDCPSIPCTVHKDYKAHIKAFCNKTNPIFHIDSTPVDFDASFMSCSGHSWLNIYLRVGRYDGRIHSENNSTLAMEEQNFTMVFDISRQDGYYFWTNGHGDLLANFNGDCTEFNSYYDKNRLNITCDGKTSRLHIKNVTLSDDGIFTCSERFEGVHSLFRLTVNVPVTSVSIQPQSQDLYENQDATFVCQVEESKPEASFEWIIVYQNGSSQEIHQNSTTISKTLKGRLWLTNSTLKLTFMKYYQKIMCKATIGNLPWINSEYHALDITVARISTGATIVFCVIVVGIIVVGGLLYLKFKDPSRHDEANVQPKDMELM